MLPITKIAELNNEQLLKIILQEVAFAWGVMQMVDEEKGLTWLEVCGYDGHKKEGETEQDYEDRIHTDAHDAIMWAVGHLENDAYCDFDGIDLDAKDGVAWYDEVREDAISIVCDWFKHGQAETEED